MTAFYPSSGAQGSGADASGFSGFWGVSLCVCSVVLHLALGGAIFFIQGMPPKRVLPPVIQVDLVALALPGEVAAKPGNAVENDAVQESITPPAPKPSVVKAPAKQKEKPTVQEPVQPEPVMVAAKTTPPPAEPEPVQAAAPVRKFALKKKTFKPDKVLESARQTLEKKVENSTSSADATLESAFSRLEKAVEAQAGSRPKAGVAGVGAKGDKTAYGAIDLYNVELMYRIRQNWAFNERLAKAEKGIEARVLIKILQNGQIRDVWFETRSGNRYLDESALKAVKKSNPLPPLPKGYATYDVGLQFTPSGLK